MLEVVWNNVVIGTIDPAGPMTSYGVPVVTATGIAAKRSDHLPRDRNWPTGPSPDPGTRAITAPISPTSRWTRLRSVDEDGLESPRSARNEDSQTGRQRRSQYRWRQQRSDSDRKPQYSVGRRTMRMPPTTFATLVQDTPGGAGNRSVTFTDANVTVAGGCALTSQGVTVSYR